MRDEDLPELGDEQLPESGSRRAQELKHDISVMEAELDKYVYLNRAPRRVGRRC